MAFDRRLARLAAPISSGVRQGGRICPPNGARSAEYPSGARVNPRLAEGALTRARVAVSATFAMVGGPK